MEKKGNDKLVALAQIFILSFAIISFSFIIGSQTVSAEDSPSLRIIPGGRSSDPYTQEMVKQLSQMSAEDIYGEYNNLEVSAEAQHITGPRTNIIDIPTMIAAGVGTYMAVTAYLASMQTIGVMIPITASGVSVMGVLNVVGAAFAGAQLAKIILNIAGSSARNMQFAETSAYVGAGIGAAVGIYLLAATAVGPVGWIAAGVALLFTFIFQAVGHQKYSREVFTYESKLWQPVEGGKRCEDCDALKYGCSEYQCHTYGAACILINPDSEDSACIWENEGDITPPTIEPLEGSLLSLDYAYVAASEGAKLTYKGGCLPAFKGVTFGVQTNKSSQCFYDLERKSNIEEMTRSTNFGSSAYGKEHKVAISHSNFPSQFAVDDLGLNIENGEDQNIYFMCKSVNGYPVPKPFLLTFCIDDTPDLNVPVFIGSTPIQDAYIKTGVKSMDFSIVIDEPADCSWDFNDIDYAEMANPMINCSQNFVDYTFPPYNYGCKGTLNGLKDDMVNKFYIRCKDKPSLNESDPDQKEKRVVNEQSHELRLIGTSGLVLDKVIVNGEESGIELKDSTDPIEIKFEAMTSQGAEKNGNARCTYRAQGTEASYEFSNEGSFEFTSINTHDTNLFEEEYSYEITCCDLANNCDSKELAFSVKTDTAAPLVARAYRDSGQMKIITTEYSNCFYGTDGCSYIITEGIALTTYDHLEHTTPWDSDIDKYVKCEDEFGNPPAPAECSIVVRGYTA